MRAMFLPCLFVASAAITTLAYRDQAADRIGIQRLLDTHGMAWTKGDPVAAAAVMTEDADWVSGSGSVYEGRAAIEGAHREWLSGDAKGTRHAHPGTPRIRFIRSDVAIVDGDSYMGGIRDEKGNPIPDVFSRYTAVMVKDGGEWKVTAFRSLPQLKSKLTSADVH